jgi:hypothetical protein
MGVENAGSERGPFREADEQLTQLGFGEGFPGFSKVCRQRDMRALQIARIARSTA